MLRDNDTAIVSAISTPPANLNSVAIKRIMLALNSVVQRFSLRSNFNKAKNQTATSTLPGSKQFPIRTKSRAGAAYNLCDKLLPFILASSNEIVARPCKTREDIEAAYKLVYKEYLARGYCAKNPSRMHYNFYSVLPGSLTFVLEKDDAIIGTVSLLADSPCGLPLESLFPAEVANFRTRGRCLAEVGLLALDSEIFGQHRFSMTDFRKMSALFRLFKLLFDYAHSTGVTDLLIAVHPKHQTLYEYIKFEPFGQVKSYEGACGNPALPMRNDVPMAVNAAPKRGGLSVFHGKRIYTEKTFEHHFCWTKETAREFLRDKLPLAQKLPNNARNHLFNYLGIETSDRRSHNAHPNAHPNLATATLS